MKKNEGEFSLIDCVMFSSYRYHRKKYPKESPKFWESLFPRWDLYEKKLKEENNG